MLERLARWSYRHRWRTLVLWIVALVGFLALVNVLGARYAQDFSLPGSESQRAFDVLEERFPARSGDTVDIVFTSESGVADPAVQQAMEGMFEQVLELPHVLGITSPYDEAGARQVSQDGTIAFATVQYDVTADKMTKEQVQQLLDLGAATEAQVPGLEVEFAGGPIQLAQFEPPGGAELVGLAAAIIILLITFGSVLAMGLPILSALFGIGIGLSLVLLFSHSLSVPNFTPQLASMIGLGVGVDYALFIVTRYRSSLHEGMDPEAAVVRAMTTAGRAVLFAGSIVVVSFLGILLMQFNFVQGIAVGGAATVLVTMLVSISLLPAMLGFVGKNIDKWHIPRLRRVESGGKASFWYRWSRVIQRRPWPSLLVGLAIIGALTIPLFAIRLGFADSGNDPEHLTTRKAYDLLVQGFGPGFNGPLVLVAELESPQDLEALNGLSQTLQTTEGVAFASPPIPNDTGTAAIITVYPTSSPQSAETVTLVKHLRDDVIPQATEGTGAAIYVGGFTAIGIDFTDIAARRLPILMAAVIGVSFILLMIIFRSLLVPLKAAIMNLLSIGAAFGVMVAIFQWGWGASVIGIGSPGPIEPWIPMMLFTILFGLSMDYEVFLLSRIREEYSATKDNAISVANGVATTGRVITAAAAIMIAVFLSFVFGFDIRQIKMFGLGLAVAVLVDATIVRMLLVPATMELLGDLNWWLPKWLDRLLPRFKIEEEAEAIAQAEYERAMAEAAAGDGQAVGVPSPNGQGAPEELEPGPRR
jgi:RND superfamily putative drug exporter